MTLKDLRTEKQLTQKELCCLTGLPYNTYRHYEYGDTFPGKKEMIALAKLYGMSPGELFDELIGWKTP